MSETPSEAVIQTAARLLAAGRAVEAADRLQRLVDEAPTYAAAHVLLASALDASGRPGDALEIWRRAAFLVPHSPLVHRERQRLVDAQETETTEQPSEPIETWDEPEPTEVASTETGQAETAPDETEMPLASLPADELVTTGEPKPEPTSDVANSTDAPPDPAADLEAADRTEEQEAVEAPEEPLTEPPRAEIPAEEPAETPLLPPEGNASSTPQAPVADFELEDDGWTIIEDDVASLGADEPIDAALLPPEPEEAGPPITPMPEAPSEPTEASAPLTDDLDDLITQLDAAPRIKPDPTFQGPAVTFDESSMDDMVSETLAKIYAAQHQYVEAAVVYEKLAEREPEHADELLERAAEMRDKAS